MYSCKQFHISRSKFLPPNVFLWPIYDPVRHIKLDKLHLAHLSFSSATAFGTPSHCIHPDSLCKMQLALLLWTLIAVQAVSTTYQFSVRDPPGPRQMECLSSLKELDNYYVLIDRFRIAVNWINGTNSRLELIKYRWFVWNCLPKSWPRFIVYIGGVWSSGWV